MPATIIDYEAGRDALLAKDEPAPEEAISCVVSSSVGLLLLDIQGELNLPMEHDLERDKHEVALVDKIHNAIKFGKLVFEKDGLRRVTLFIGESQRLLGKIDDLPKPVGVLRVQNMDTESSNKINLIDVVYKKVTFDQRPLPIM